MKQFPECFQQESDEKMKSMRLFWIAYVLGMLGSVVGGPLAEFSELSPETLYPRGAKLTVSPEGHFLVNGVPRYLPGTIFYEGVADTFAVKTDGYPESLAWLYEHPHGYETHQRTGFDATGMCTSNAWIDKYRPGKHRSFAKMGEDFLKVVIGSGLPLYVDFTAASWNHGQLKYVEGQSPCKEAFTQPGNNFHHWMYYNPNHPEGMRLYQEMWSHGVKYALSLGARPFVYELFNEPGLNDLSPTSRALFVEKMRARYKTIEKLNAAWSTSYPSFEALGQFKNEVENPALAVEWIKFMEESFTNAVRLGVKTVREADPRPEILICVQPLRANLGNVNQFEINRYLNAVCTCTGGGTAINAREFLSMAEGGKPVFDGETYLGHSVETMRSNLITQYARGLNASFAFKWDRRPWDPLWKQKDGGKRLADKFSFLLLNPYCVKTEELRGIRQAKEEILLTSHLFTPRNRGIASQIAVLHSQPARRLARATGRSSYNLYYDYAQAAERIALPYDIVFEGQLAQRAARYKVILVPGVACLTDEARAALEKYVLQGGTAVFIEEALQLDEYGNPLPSTVFPGVQPGEERVAKSERVMLGDVPLHAAIVRTPRFAEATQWQVLGKGQQSPAVWKRRLGQGEMLYLATKLPDTSIADFLQWFIHGKGIQATCKLWDEETGTRSLDIEPHAAIRGAERGFILVNKSLRSRCVRLTPSVRCPAWCIPGEKTLLRPDSDGSIVLLLKKGEAKILVGGEEAVLAKYAPQTTLAVADCKKQALAFLQAEEASRKQENTAFHCKKDNIKMLDLRAVANSSYTDRVAGDGKGGWTDQGENCLRNVPWEVTDCNGVPVDFIRPDMNDGRSCIVVGSQKLLHGPRELRGIPVHCKASRIFFLQGYAWGSGGEEVFRYVVNYTDGTRVEIPVICGQNVGDWYWMGAKITSPTLVPGWSNRDGRGLWLFAWSNPSPNVEIASLDIVSSWNNAIGLIGGITVEKPDETSFPLVFTNKGPRPWGGATVEFDEAVSSFSVLLSPKCLDWCGANISFAQTYEVPKTAEGYLVFEVNGLKDEWGRHQGGQRAQIAFRFEDSTGERIPSPKRPWRTPVDEDPDSWQEIRFRLDTLIPANLPPDTRITGFFFQYQQMRDYKSGLAVRNIRIQK
ncbi:MAG: beta-galactosidase [Victivallales bacterium]|nr:beta-galactosidase [Victivallales bacterium]